MEIIGSIIQQNLMFIKFLKITKTVFIQILFSIIITFLKQIAICESKDIYIQHIINVDTITNTQTLLIILKNISSRI